MQHASDDLDNAKAPIRLLVVAHDDGVSRRLADALGDPAERVSARAVVGAAAGLESLRQETFAAIVATHTAGGVDALELTRAARASGDETPIILLTDQSVAELEESAYAADADACCEASQTSPRRLVIAVRRAMEQRLRAGEVRRLRGAESRRLRQERDDAERLLADQRALLSELEALPRLDAVDAAPATPRSAESARREPLASLYESILRAYVVMGVGTLAEDIGRLAERLVADGLSAPQLMELHLEVVGKVVESLGARGGRHVLARADLLALEVMVHLAEAYRRRYVAAGAGAALCDPGPGADFDGRRLAPWVDRFAA